MLKVGVRLRRALLTKSRGQSTRRDAASNCSEVPGLTFNSKSRNLLLMPFEVFDSPCLTTFRSPVFNVAVAWD